MLVPALGSDSSVLRWPAFAPAAVAAGVLAVFAFPLVMGAISVGALEIHRGREGELSAAELAEMLLFADAALPQVLDHLSGPGTADGPDLSSSGFEYRWAEVHQATGIVFGAAEQRSRRGVLAVACPRLPHGCRLSQVASAVVERRLRCEPDTGNAGGASFGG